MYAFSYKHALVWTLLWRQAYVYGSLHVLHDSEGGARGRLGQKRQFQRDVIIEEPLTASSDIDV